MRRYWSVAEENEIPVFKSVYVSTGICIIFRKVELTLLLYSNKAYSHHVKEKYDNGKWGASSILPFKQIVKTKRLGDKTSRSRSHRAWNNLNNERVLRTRQRCCNWCWFPAKTWFRRKCRSHSWDSYIILSLSLLLII